MFAFVAHRVDALALALRLGVRDAEPPSDEAALAAIAAPAVPISLPGLSARGWRLDAVLAHAGPAAADEVLAACPVPDVLPPELAMAAPYLLASRALVHLACGRTALALADVEYRDAFIAQRGGFPSPASWDLALPLARAAAGDEAGARLAAEAFLRRERVRGIPARLAVALRGVARTDPERAVAMLEQALELHGEGRMRLEHARTCVELGLAYRRRGQRRAARAVLEQGADLAFACQAAPLLEQARVELRILGARPRRLAFSGVESLTASERRAADLAAQSATNREIAEQLFVTVKTVESRLGAVYRKLGIATRHELAAALGQPSVLVAEPEHP